MIGPTDDTSSETDPPLNPADVQRAKPWEVLCKEAFDKMHQKRFLSTGPDAKGGLGRPLNLKFNSTSSIYLRDTVANPDMDELTWCISKAIARMISEGHKKGNTVYIELFDERKHPLHMKSMPWPEGYTAPDPAQMATEEDVFLFINPVTYKLRVKPESGVMCVVYMERIIEKTRLNLDSWNWRWVTLSCLILATKVYEDLAVWNADFKEAFPKLNSQELNTLELELLKYLEFSVSIDRALYTRYFFAIKELSDMDRNAFMARPLDLKDLQRLEDVSKATETKLKSRKKLRTSAEFEVKVGEDGRAHLVSSSGSGRK